MDYSARKTTLYINHYFFLRVQFNTVLVHTVTTCTDFVTIYVHSIIHYLIQFVCHYILMHSVYYTGSLACVSNFSFYSRLSIFVDLSSYSLKG